MKWNSKAQVRRRGRRTSAGRFNRKMDKVEDLHRLTSKDTFDFCVRSSLNCIHAPAKDFISDGTEKDKRTEDRKPQKIKGAKTDEGSV